MQRRAMGKPGHSSSQGVGNQERSLPGLVQGGGLQQSQPPVHAGRGRERPAQHVHAVADAQVGQAPGFGARRRLLVIAGRCRSLQVIARIAAIASHCKSLQAIASRCKSLHALQPGGGGCNHATMQRPRSGAEAPDPPARTGAHLRNFPPDRRTGEPRGLTQRDKLTF